MGEGFFCVSMVVLASKQEVFSRNLLAKFSCLYYDKTTLQEEKGRGYMGITFNENTNIFKLDSDQTSYLIGLVGKEKFAGHIYFGQRLQEDGVDDLLRITEPPFTPDTNNRDRIVFMEACPFEYGSHGVGDYRTSSIRVKTQRGTTAINPLYRSHRIYEGKPAISGMPATFGSEKECTTLELELFDETLQVAVTLFYTVWEKLSVIVRHTKVENQGKETIWLNKAMSASLDMDNRDYELITLHGAWARERHIQRRRLGIGNQSVTSLRGETGHQEQPFLALCTPQTTQEQGEVYGLHLIYSGNFKADAQVAQYGTVRAQLGINEEDFSWQLQSGECFETPEAVLVYSNEGIGGMSRTYHDLYRNHLIRSPYVMKKRPVLINNWEATYFDFNTEKLLDIAKKSAECGIEMLVMDDGWFGHREDDNTSLGDWFVNEKKIAGGLKYLVDQVNALGMKFGIWFEPEMVSPDSELYRAHPDWAIAIEGRTPALGRGQLVLDLTRKEVRDHVMEQVEEILSGANIEYVKWDMNRPLSDIAGAKLPTEQMGEFYHRYVLGLYEMQERLITRFPNLLLENCSGGGARFDPGMLYYSPQIWCSDDTDAIERLAIQEGTSMIYPLSCMGAHVSVCPNHTVGRNTPFFTRGVVALAGTFGYELDITKLSTEDQQAIPEQIKLYHRFAELMVQGDYYRLISTSEGKNCDCYMVVDKEKKHAVVSFVQVLGQAQVHSRNVRLAGLDAAKKYRVQGIGVEYDKTLGGDALMYAGVQIPVLRGDYQALLLEITEDGVN